jgi:hypothetical protein
VCVQAREKRTGVEGRRAMSDADYEAYVFPSERLEAERIPIDALMESDKTREAGGDDAA